MPSDNNENHVSFFIEMYINLSDKIIGTDATKILV
jgi:hypothetical protein